MRSGERLEIWCLVTQKGSRSAQPRYRRARLPCSVARSRVFAATGLILCPYSNLLLQSRLLQERRRDLRDRCMVNVDLVIECLHFLIGELSRELRECFA